MRSERSKACDIKPEVRYEVMERDKYQCIICGRGTGLQIAHLVPRSLGGLGIKENLVTMCVECHTKSHNELPQLEDEMRGYLNELYEGFTDEQRIYRKWKI